MGIQALASNPMKPGKGAPGLVDAPVDVGGVTIRPGNWLFADEGGWALGEVCRQAAALVLPPPLNRLPVRPQLWSCPIHAPACPALQTASWCPPSSCRCPARRRRRSWLLTTLPSDRCSPAPWSLGQFYYILPV